MKVNKAMQKRALAEYNGRKDFERLLNKHFVLCQRCTQLEGQLREAEEEVARVTGQRDRFREGWFGVFALAVTLAAMLIGVLACHFYS